MMLQHAHRTSSLHTAFDPNPHAVPQSVRCQNALLLANNARIGEGVAGLSTLPLYPALHDLMAQQVGWGGGPRVVMPKRVSADAFLFGERRGRRSTVCRDADEVDGDGGGDDDASLCEYAESCRSLLRSTVRVVEVARESEDSIRTEAGVFPHGQPRVGEVVWQENELGPLDPVNDGSLAANANVDMSSGEPVTAPQRPAKRTFTKRLSDGAMNVGREVRRRVSGFMFQRRRSKQEKNRAPSAAECGEAIRVDSAEGAPPAPAPGTIEPLPSASVSPLDLDRPTAQGAEQLPPPYHVHDPYHQHGVLESASTGSVSSQAPLLERQTSSLWITGVDDQRRQHKHLLQAVREALRSGKFDRKKVDVRFKEVAESLNIAQPQQPVNVEGRQADAAPEQTLLRHQKAPRRAPVSSSARRRWWRPLRRNNSEPVLPVYTRVPEWREQRASEIAETLAMVMGRQSGGFGIPV